MRSWWRWYDRGRIPLHTIYGSDTMVGESYHIWRWYNRGRLPLHTIYGSDTIVGDYHFIPYMAVIRSWEITASYHIWQWYDGGRLPLHTIYGSDTMVGEYRFIPYMAVIRWWENKCVCFSLCEVVTHPWKLRIFPGLLSICNEFVTQYTLPDFPPYFMQWTEGRLVAWEQDPHSMLQGK